MTQEPTKAYIQEMPFEANQPLVSVITPAFNSERFIAQTIESVIAQTYTNWEMLIAVDAGTTDSTLEIVKKFSNKDPRIKLVHIPNARGVSLSRNTAIERAKGQYIAFLDSDDLFLPLKLERQIKFMEDNNYAFTATGYCRLSEDGKEVGQYIAPKEHATYEDTLLNNQISCPTVIIHRGRAGEFRLLEGRHEDYILWLDILKRGLTCYGLNEDLSRYRYVSSSRSRMIFTSVLMRWNIYRNYEGLGFWRSFYTLIYYILTALLKRRAF